MQKVMTSELKTVAPPGSDLVSILKNRFNAVEVFLTGRGASALYTACRSLGQPGSFVGIPSHVCPSIPMSVIRAGYRPWYLDINEYDFNLKIHDLVSLPQNTSAIIAPHIYGHPLLVEPIMDFCSDRKIIFIEDIAQAFGMSIVDKPAGSFGDLAIMSFHPSKLIPGLGGGALIVNNRNLPRFEKLENEIKNLPREPQNYQERSADLTKRINPLLNSMRDGRSSGEPITEIYSANLDLIPFRFNPEKEFDNLRAMSQIDAALLKRRERSDMYREMINHPLIQHPKPVSGSPLFRYSILCGGANPEQLRNNITRKLRDNCVHASNLYFPVHEIIPDGTRRSLPAAESIGGKIINLWLDDCADAGYIEKTSEIINNA